MANLYPPYIEGKISAQYGNELKIPFQHNRTADKTQPAMTALIKTVFNSDQIEILEGAFEEDIASFTLDSNSLLEVGQYYKIQLAYGPTSEKDKYYSTAGVFKYTSTPQVSVQVEPNKLIGQYSNEDTSEQEYSYQFDIYENGEFYHSSGEIIHTKEDIYNPPVGFAPNEDYSVVYTVTTINGIKISVQTRYYESSITPYYFNYKDASIGIYNIEENGSIQVKIDPKERLVGKFRLLRYENDNPAEEIASFNMDINEITMIYEDYMIEHGVNYTYALQAYSGSNYANKLYSNKLMCHFDDMFLCDNERQLCIKFDPKVTSFKTTLQESKVDTMGSQYPFFFRNGMVKYKEFPISGLISTHCDENNLFLEGARDLGTNLTHENFVSEREFKLKVLDWLNNGKPKIFRSPAEGNYIVRLMNISLSPKDQLGRMLHSFNAQAYEIEDYNIAKRKYYKTVTDTGLQQIELESNHAISLKDKTYIEVYSMQKEAEITFSYGKDKTSSMNLGPSTSFIFPFAEKITSIACNSGKVNVSYYPFDKNSGTYLEHKGEIKEFFEQYSGVEIKMAENGVFNIIYMKFSTKPYEEGLNYKVTIHAPHIFEKDLELDLSPIVVNSYNEETQQYDNPWCIEKHADGIVIQSKNYLDGLFQPNSITVGNGVYAYVYYSKAVNDNEQSS